MSTAARTLAWMALALLSALQNNFAAATPAIIFSQPDFQSPVRDDPGDLLMLPGYGFSASDTVVYRSLTDTTQALVAPTSVPTSNTASSGVAKIVNDLNVPNSLTVSLPTVMTTDQSYALWVRNSAGEWSNGVRINDARPMWLSPDSMYSTGNIAGLPRYLKVIGRNLEPMSGGTTQVRLTGPTTYLLTAANDNDPTTAIERYVAKVTLPASMQVGTYNVQVSRDGVSWVAPSESPTINVTPPPPSQTSFPVSAYGGCQPGDNQDDTPCIVSAIAAARANGGGVVEFAAGDWDMINLSTTGVTGFGVLVPPNVSLRGSTGATTRIVRNANWDYHRSIFTLQGQNTVSNITFSDAHVYQTTDDVRPLILLGLPPAQAHLFSQTDPLTLSNVTITNNVFDKPGLAIQDGGMPMDHVYITYNTFGAYYWSVYIDGASRNSESIIAYNTFLPGSYVDPNAGGGGQGSLPNTLSSGYHLDFSNNVADGTSTQYLQNPATDAKGFRAAYFWALRGNHEAELVSQNTATCSGDKAGDGEAFSFDGNHNFEALPTKQPALSSSANTVTVAGPLMNSTDMGAYPDGYGKFTGFWITIAQGPGQGQSRKIVSYTGTGPITFTVSPAWDVPPQTTSQILIAKSIWQVFVVDNYIDQRSQDDHGAPLCTKANANRPSGGVIGLWTQAFDSVIENNRQYDTSGILLSVVYTIDPALAAAAYTKLQNFVEVRGNTIVGEYAYGANCSYSGIHMDYAAIDTAGYPPPILGYGVSISHNTVTHADGQNDGAITFSPGWLTGPAPDVSGWNLMESTSVFANTINDIQPPLPATDSRWPSCTGSSWHQTNRLGTHLLDGMIWHTTFAANSCNNVANGVSSTGSRDGTGTFLDGGTASKRVCDGASANSCECAALSQDNQVTQTTTASSTATSYPGAQTAGDLNVVVVNWAGAAATVTLTDTSGNSYSSPGPVITVPASATGALPVYQAVFFGTVLHAASSNTLTATFSVPVAATSLAALEYHGIDVNTPVDVKLGTWGTGTTADSGWATTAQGNELLLSVTGSPGGVTAVNGYSTRVNISGNAAVVADRFAPTAGAYNATATIGSPSYWMSHLFSLKLVGGGNANTQGLTSPGSLAATPVSGNVINLSWAASTDNWRDPTTNANGVSGYLLERCAGFGCQNYAQIAKITSGTVYTDSGLTPSTIYSYRVRVTDVAGLISTYSSSVTATATP